MSDGVFWPEFEQWLLDHGLDSMDIAEIAWRPPSTCNRSGPMYLEVLVYKHNEGGHRYMDKGEAATETRIVPMLHLPMVDVVRVLYRPS